MGWGMRIVPHMHAGYSVPWFLVAFVVRLPALLKSRDHAPTVLHRRIRIRQRPRGSTLLGQVVELPSSSVPPLGCLVASDSIPTIPGFEALEQDG